MQIRTSLNLNFSSDRILISAFPNSFTRVFQSKLIMYAVENVICYLYHSPCTSVFQRGTLPFTVFQSSTVITELFNFYWPLRLYMTKQLVETRKVDSSQITSNEIDLSSVTNKLVLKQNHNQYNFLGFFIFKKNVCLSYLFHLVFLHNFNA